MKYFSPKIALKREVARQRLRNLEAASRKPRLSGWNTENSRQISGLDTKTIRDRSRYLTRNNPFGSRALEVYSTYICGNGIKPYATRENQRSTKHDDLLKFWADSSQIDVRGVNNLYGLQTLIIKHLVRDGEVFVQKVLTRDKFPLKIKVIDTDFLDRGKNNSKTKDGIEFDKHGKPLAYYFFTEDTKTGFQSKSKRVPASEIIHVINQDDNSLAPRPFLTPAVVRLYDLDLYEDYELQKQKLAALFCGVMREIEPTDYADDVDIQQMEPGQIIKAPPGMSVDFSSPPSLENYEEYIRRSCMTIATALSIPYNLLASDWSESNYSSLKACYLSWFRFIEQKQNIFVTQFCDKLFDWFLESCELVNIDIKGVRAIWSLPKKDILDPQKEFQANEIGLKNNILSLKQILRERGEDPDEVFREISETNKELKELGIYKTQQEEGDDWIEEE